MKRLLLLALACTVVLPSLALDPEITLRDACAGVIGIWIFLAGAWVLERVRDK